MKPDSSLLVSAFGGGQSAILDHAAGSRSGDRDTALFTRSTTFREGQPPRILPVCEGASFPKVPSVTKPITMNNVTNRAESLLNALAPDHHSRAAYVGRISQTERVTVWDESGQPFEKEVSFLISWDSISKILELARERARI